MVNAMQHGRTAATANGNGSEIANLEHNGGDEMRQRKKAVKEQQQPLTNDDDNEDELDFDVDIAGHHAMPQHPIAMGVEKELHKPHLPRANLAVTRECPFGSTKNGWAKQHKNYSTLEQHCLFFDPDADGVIWPTDTFRGLWQLGYPFWLIVSATVIIHTGFSWFSSDAWILPDPFFRLKVKQMHRSKYGSDTHVFDQEGRFHPQLFENIFTKYDKENKGGLTFMDGMRMLYGNRVVADFAGMLAGFIEWLLTYFLIANEEGLCMKEDLRKCYDGSIFFEKTNSKDNHPVIRNDIK